MTSFPVARSRSLWRQIRLINLSFRSMYQGTTSLEGRSGLNKLTNHSSSAMWTPLVRDARKVAKEDFPAPTGPSTTWTVGMTDVLSVDSRLTWRRPALRGVVAQRPVSEANWAGRRVIRHSLMACISCARVPAGAAWMQTRPTSGTS